MNDRDIEDLLRRHFPADPPPDLRSRIVTAPVAGQRAWAGAAAAAARLVGAI
jgi:hypothetical protein